MVSEEHALELNIEIIKLTAQVKTLEIEVETYKYVVERLPQVLPLLVDDEYKEDGIRALNELINIIEKFQADVAEARK